MLLHRPCEQPAHFRVKLRAGVLVDQPVLKFRPEGPLPDVHDLRHFQDFHLKAVLVIHILCLAVIHMMIEDHLGLLLQRREIPQEQIAIDGVRRRILGLKGQRLAHIVRLVRPDIMEQRQHHVVRDLIFFISSLCFQHLCHDVAHPHAVMCHALVHQSHCLIDQISHISACDILYCHFPTSFMYS